MIDIVKQTPWEYSSQSRDYQVIARLYTALFNYVKMHIDNMSIWDSNIDNKLTMLRAKTLNFNPDHSWDLDDLEAVTTCFKYLIRNKGTVKALEYLVDILMRIENIVGESINDAVVMKYYNVTIRVPEDLLTFGIIEDLVKYLLPSGLTYDIIKYKSYNLSDVVYTDLYYNENNTNDESTIAYEEWYDSDRMFVGTDGVTSSKTSVIQEYTDKQNMFTETFIYGDEEGDEIAQESEE